MQGEGRTLDAHVAAVEALVDSLHREYSHVRRQVPAAPPRTTDTPVLKHYVSAVFTSTHATPHINVCTAAAFLMSVRSPAAPQQQLAVQKAGRTEF